MNLLSESRFAIVFRMLDSGSSWPGVMAGPAGCGRGEGAGAGADGILAYCSPPCAPWRGAAQDSMSRLMMRPPGPLPETAPRSMLRCAAMLRASGLDFTRPPVVGAAGACCGLGGAGAAGVRAAGSTAAG